MPADDIIAVPCGGIFKIRIRYGDAVEAPFIFIELDVRRVADGGSKADVVECGHRAVAVAVCDAQFEDLSVDLADGLLGRKGHRAHTAGLLIVQEDVLDVGVHAHLGRALDDVGSDDAALDAVLRVVLEVTACQRIAVGVHRGTVPAVDVHPQGLVADGTALLIREFRIPGGSDDGCADPAPSCDLGTVREIAVLQLVRAVVVFRGGFVDGSDRRRGEGTAGDESSELIPGKLIHEFVPLCIAEGDALHILQGDGIHAVFAFDARALRPACHILFGLDPEVLVVGLDLGGQAVVVIKLGGAGVGLRAAVVGNVLVVDGAHRLFLEGAVVVAVEHIAELQLQIVRVTDLPIHFERDFVAVDELGAAQVMIFFIQQPVAGQGVVQFPRIARLRIDVVGRIGIVVLLVIDVCRGRERAAQEDVVRVVHDLEHNVAGVDLVTEVAVVVRVVVVEFRQILGIDDDLDSLRVAGFNDRRLGVADEVDRSLLDLALEILGRAVELDDRLAGNVAGVLDVDGDGDVIFHVGFSQAACADPHVGELEGRVREAIAEREGDRGVIPGVRSVLIRRRSEFFIHGLVVTIAHVDALGVVDREVVTFVLGIARDGRIHQHMDGAAAVARTAAALAAVEAGRDLLAVDGVVTAGIAEHVVHRGVGVEIVHPEVDEAAGRVDPAGEDPAERQVTVPAGRAQPEDGVEIFIADDVGDLHDCRGLQEDDDLIEVALCLLILYVCEERFLCIRQGQVVICRIRMSFDVVRLVIDELGTRSADRDDRGGIIFERRFDRREEVVRSIVVLMALELGRTRRIVEIHVLIIGSVASFVDADALGPDELFHPCIDREAVRLVVLEAFIDRLLRQADPVILRCDGAVGGDALCARTAAAILHERTEDSHVPLACCKRKRVVLILHQNETFAGDLDVEFAARLHGLHVRIVIRFIHVLRSIEHACVCAERTRRHKAREDQRGRKYSDGEL